MANQSHSTFVIPIIQNDAARDVNTFFEKCLLSNLPCLFTSQLTINWRCRIEWITRYNDNIHQDKINFKFLNDNFGRFVAPIANCSTNEFCSHSKSSSCVGEFLKYWQNVLPDRSISVNSIEKEEFVDNRVTDTLYLKDWHFTRDVKSYPSPYTTPSFFASDWLNEFWSQRSGVTDDYRFVYMGPPHSWTPYHCDVYNSYSWSANITGMKQWIFVPPWKASLFLTTKGELPFDIREHIFDKKVLYLEYIEDQKLDKQYYINDLDKYCNLVYYNHTEMSDSLFWDIYEDFDVLVINQHQGQILYVPSGWHHQVHNIEDVISINHNWLNACNIRQSFIHLKLELHRVIISIDDCKEMDGFHQQCQLVLLSLSGTNYPQFALFLLTITLPRIDCVSHILEQCDSAKTGEYTEHLDSIYSDIKSFLTETGELNLSSNKDLLCYLDEFIPDSALLFHYASYMDFENINPHSKRKMLFFLYELHSILQVLHLMLEESLIENYLNSYSGLFGLLGKVSKILSIIFFSVEQNYNLIKK